MKNKVCIIITYFGKFPDSIAAFLWSCKKNSDFKWLIFTDDELPRVPENVEVVYCTLSDIKARIERITGFEVALNAPYKLCDYRPAFGLIFEEHLKAYDFWGYGDIDLVYGDLSRFITDELLEKYDKIYPCGHLSLVRNELEINKVFMLADRDSKNYRDVFTSDTSCIFDEYQGLNEKLIKVGKKVYGLIDFADMDVVYKRFRTADKKTISIVFPKFLYKKNLPSNYRNQIFYCENGKAYRAYVDKTGQVNQQEVVYIHYRYKIPCPIQIYECTSFYLTNQGFVEKTNIISKEEILSLNPYLGWGKELKEYIRFVREQMIYKLGKNRKLRNLIRILKGKRRYHE